MAFMLRTAVFLFDGYWCGRGYLKTSGEDWYRAEERFSGSLKKGRRMPKGYLKIRTFSEAKT